MRRLRQFLRKDKKADTEAHPPPDPAIPSLPSVEHKPWQPAPQTQSPFFRLAPELRRLILCLAFGDRTVHVDFRLRPLPGTLFGGYPPSVRWTMLPSRAPGDSWELAWRWYGFVCHRNAPPGVGERHIPPYMDTCLSGVANCESWPGDFPAKCQIGCMGFLLSCKKAHDEGSEVLYSTNTLFIESQPLVHAILRQGLAPGAPRLTGPGMQSVTSLQMTWDITLIGSYDGSQEAAERARFLEDLQLLPRAFPQLVRLHLVFERHLYWLNHPSPSNNLEAIEAVFLAPLLGMSTRLHALRDFSVAMPEDIFNMLVGVVGAIPGDFMATLRTEGFWAVRVWYPFTAEAQRDSGRVGTGFWLNPGPGGHLTSHNDL